MLNIGDKIRQFRTQKGYSQDDMARLLGINLKTYTNLERNTQKYLDIEKLQKVAALLGVNWIDFLPQQEQSLQINTNLTGGDNSTQHNSPTIYNSPITNKDLTHEIEKLRLELSHKDEKIAALTSKISDLEKINALLTQQNK
jgi:transcriptional regulator with XRE-family HTH domain